MTYKQYYDEMEKLCRAAARQNHEPPRTYTQALMDTIEPLIDAIAKLQVEADKTMKEKNHATP